MNTCDAVKEQLCGLLAEKALSVHALAIASSVPPSTIKNILYGKSRNPGIVTLKMLCDGLKISLPDFFNAEIFRKLDEEE